LDHRSRGAHAPHDPRPDAASPPPAGPADPADPADLALAAASAQLEAPSPVAAPTSQDGRTFVTGGAAAAADLADLGHYLVVRRGREPGRRVEVRDRPLTVGRAEASDLWLDDRAVSARHCSFSLVGTNLWVKDLGSTNGTYLDGMRLSRPSFVRPGATLQIGTHVLVYEQRLRDDVEQDGKLVAELVRARSYVEALLPARLDDRDVRCDWCFVPSAVLGGDAFGYQRLADGRLAIYLIDVCGHGAAAALHSVSVINTLRRQTLAGVDLGDPAGVLAGLNTVFQMDAHGGMYFTAWYGVYDPLRRVLTHAAAGHPPALLRGPGGGEPAPLAARGPGVGLLPAARYRAAEVPVGPGAALYVFSDGIFEFKRPDGQRWSLDAFLATVRQGAGRAPAEVARLREAVWREAGTDQLEDDLSLLVFDLA